MIKNFLSVVFLAVGVIGLSANVQDRDSVDLKAGLKADTLMLDSTIMPPPTMIGNLDSLVNLWYVGKTATDLVLDTIPALNDSVFKRLPDSVYMQRLADIESPITFVFNKKVRSYIELYTIKKRDLVQGMLGLKDYYFPTFEAELDAANMPLELKYLPVIESALNPRAFSRAGASGLWQFMYYTGKRYGLEINSFIDERRDPVKSTKAAVRFLEDLHKIYDDWLLVIAAYNCGPGNVNKAIRRAGGHKDFWKIYYYLPRETRGYVPAFIAAAYTLTYPEEHHLYPIPSDLPRSTDTIMVTKPLHFKQVSELMHINIDYLRDLNPQYRRDVIPAGKKAYPLRLGFNYVTDFVAVEDSVYNYNRTKYFPEGKLVVSPSKTYYPPVAPKGHSKVYYTVKQGDAVGLIAQWFHVRTSDLRYWNNIHRNLIRVGQKLVVYVPKNKVSKYKKINTMTFAQKQASIGKSVTASKPKTIKKEPEDDSYIYYTVRRGDNLWSIAKKFSGVTNESIMKLNNINDVRKISPGQRLKIKKKS